LQKLAAKTGLTLESLLLQGAERIAV